MRLNKLIRHFAIAAAIGAAACGGNDKTADNGLQNDLSLAAQQQTRLDSVSALEANAAAKAPVNNVSSSATVRPRTTSTAPRRTSSSTRRTTGSSSSGSTAGTSSGTVTTSSGGDVVVQKNTKRDAAIGAAAGAVIGATTSKDKIKGGVIGGVIGGVLGGVIGNNVDVKKKKPPV